MANIILCTLLCILIPLSLFPQKQSTSAFIWDNDGGDLVIDPDSFVLVGTEYAIDQALRNIYPAAQLEITRDVVLPETLTSFDMVFALFGYDDTLNGIGILTPHEDSILYNYVVSGGKLYIEGTRFVYNYRNSLVFSLFGSQYADAVILDSIKGDDVMKDQAFSYFPIPYSEEKLCDVLVVVDTQRAFPLFYNISRKARTEHALATAWAKDKQIQGRAILSTFLFSGLADSTDPIHTKNEVMRRITGLFYPDLLMVDNSGDSNMCSNLWNISFELMRNQVISGFDTTTYTGFNTFRYAVILYEAGDQRTNTVPQAFHTSINLAINNGQNLFIFGENIASEYRGTPFLEDTLHVLFMGESILGDSMFGRDFLTGFDASFHSYSSDSLEPLGSTAVLVTELNEIIGIAYEYTKGTKLFFGSFNLVDIGSFSKRVELLKDLLYWVGTSIEESVLRRDCRYGSIILLAGEEIEFDDIVDVFDISGRFIGAYKVISLPEGLYILKFRHKKDKAIRLIVIGKNI